MKKEIDDWKENNKHLCEIEFNSILKEKMDNLKEKRNEVNNKKFLDRKLEDELFLGFTVSDNLLDYFLSTGCTITLID